LPVGEIGSTRKQQILSAGEADSSNVESVIGEWRLGLSPVLVMGDIPQCLQAVNRSIPITNWKQHMYVIPRNTVVVSEDKTL
jgi:hypothetical protein